MSLTSLDDSPSSESKLKAIIQISEVKKCIGVLSMAMTDAAHTEIVLFGNIIDADTWDFLADLPIELLDATIQIIFRSDDNKSFVQFPIVKLDGWRQANNIITYLRNVRFARLQNPTPEQAIDRWQITAYTSLNSGQLSNSLSNILNRKE